ncbi:hypothetical protein V8D89_005350 [Ganoderma adspersum]
MMRLNFMLAALFVATAIAVPVHNAVSSLPSPQVPTAVPTTVTLPARNSVPTSVWQHNRHVIDYDSVRPLSAPATAFPLLPTPHRDEDEAVRVRAVTNTLGSVTTVAVPFPTATAPPAHAHAHAHVHRAPSGCDGDAGGDGDDDEKRDLHARMLALPIKGVGAHPHATTTLNSIKVRQLFLPTAMINAAAAPKVTVA